MATKSDFQPEEWKTIVAAAPDGRISGYVAEPERTVGRDERNVIDRDGYGGNAAKG
jgi:hypothetical protein